MSQERELEPLTGYLHVADWRTGDLRGRVRIAGVEYAVRAERTGREWRLELTLKPPEVRRVV